ncbi:hypothetical protein M0804_015110 [Polistes exclamans]|nr:hypothetical protein M0804_015111 [Polistes exclamans]KAI4473910.1 hypothetical protein M0804_015110 [Polistes exclamans]
MVTKLKEEPAVVVINCLSTQTRAIRCASLEKLFLVYKVFNEIQKILEQSSNLVVVGSIGITTTSSSSSSSSSQPVTVSFNRVFTSTTC